jgi:hypothetical protein
MAKRKRQTDKTVIDKRISDGRGQGRGSDYKPWLLVQDVPSQGLATRIKGWKTKRVHHLLSNLELSYFYILEWSPVVFDIREQYPLLPLEETLAIAEQCGIRHPTDPKTQEPVVMTTDFFITVPRSMEVIEQARTLKTAKDLQSERKLEKLEIERRYWHNRISIGELLPNKKFLKHSLKMLTGCTLFSALKTSQLYQKLRYAALQLR